LNAHADASLPVVDAHHHIWNLADLPWLSGAPVPRIFGEYSAIRRDYTIDEYQKDIASSHVVKSVYVQTNWAPEMAENEVAWVQSVSDRCGFPHAIVAFADLEQDDCGRLLDAQMRYRNMRGVRQQLHWHENPQYRFASRPDLMNSPRWQRGLREVADRGLVFELQVFAAQMPDSAAVAKAFPGLRFVLSHAGMLENHSPEGVALWRSGIQQLAACPNVYVKLSGLGTFVHRCDAALWKPIVHETVAAFGANRCMFGTNFPIESLWTTYDNLVSVARQCISDLRPADQRAILHDTAVEVYRLS
jgi:predicted TIM-barrel fold metal-dependent hydrolase